MVLVQKWPFFQHFFFRQYRPGKRLLRNSRTKNACLAYKNKKFKMSENWYISSRVNPWFWSKNGHFSSLFFVGNIGQENVFYQILDQKNAFLAYKKKKFKMSENWHFFRGVNPWFWSKSVHFSKFFFRQYRPGKCLLPYSRTKKRFSKL